MPKDPREIQTQLIKPFAPEDLEWRLQMVTEDQMRGLAVPYVTNRAIQSRLDEVVGPENWHNEYKPWHSAGKKEAQICGISIFFENRGWVTKWDGAEDTDIEPVKGGLSDSMKRAAVQWGIGRVLYNMDTVWVDTEKRGKSVIIKSSSRSALDKAYLSMLKNLGLDAAPATGTVPQSTPESAEAQLPQPPAQEMKPAPTSNTVKLPGPEYEYVIESAKIQDGMSGSSTSLTLLHKDGAKERAFARGALSELKPGVKLKNVRLTMRKQNNVVFYILEAYEIVSEPARQAA
jgi:hypothetical protein